MSTENINLTVIVTEQSNLDQERKSVTSDETNEKWTNVELREDDSSTDPKHKLDVLTSAKLVILLNDMEIEFRHVKTENRVFLDFIAANDPQLLEGMEELFSVFKNKQQENPLTLLSSIMVPITRYSKDVFSRTSRSSYFRSITSVLTAGGSLLTQQLRNKRCINLTQKSDMVLKAIEDTAKSLKKFMKESHISQRNIKGHLEEFTIRESEIREAITSFNYQICIHAIDSLTGRIPGEKFLKYMQDCLRNAATDLEKTRLRTSALRAQNKKITTTLKQRKELRQNVCAVDFDQLRVENKLLAKKLDQKNKIFLKLKKINGSSNLVLTNHNKYLRKQQENLAKNQRLLEYKEHEILATENECNVLYDHYQAAEEKYLRFKNMQKTTQVPDVMEYIRLKGNLFETLRETKKLKRRMEIQDIVFHQCVIEMTNIKGNKAQDICWLRDPIEDNKDEHNINPCNNSAGFFGG